MAKVSIIIRTKNESRDLPNCLKAISEQKHCNVETIIVDSGSTDQTVEISKAFGCKIVNIPPEEFTYGRAINIGITESKGEIAVILSAHCLPVGPTWLSNLIQPLEQHTNIVGVYGKQIPFSWASPIDVQGSREAFPNTLDEVDPVHIRFSNTFSAIKVTAWKLVKFDEKLSYAEDLDWAIKIRAFGFTTMYNPTAATYHSHKESFKTLKKRFFNENLALLQMTSPFARRSSALGFALRYLRAIIRDYTALFERDANLMYYAKWLVLIPIHRIAIYYGQFKAASKFKHFR